MTARRAMKERIDANERHEPIENADPAEAIESADPPDQSEPIDSAEPTEPIDSTEPFEPIDRSESCDHSDHFEAPADCCMPQILGHRVLGLTFAEMVVHGPITPLRRCYRRVRTTGRLVRSDGRRRQEQNAERAGCARDRRYGRSDCRLWQLGRERRARDPYDPKTSPMAMSKCMRANGVPDFPDPTRVPGGEGFNGVCVTGPDAMTVDGINFSRPALHSAEQACSFGPGVDPNSPAFKRAAAACRISGLRQVGR